MQPDFVFHGTKGLGKPSIGKVRASSGFVEIPNPNYIPAPKRKFTVCGYVDVEEDGLPHLFIGVSFLHGRLDKEYHKSEGIALALDRAIHFPVIRYPITTYNFPIMKTARRLFMEFVKELYTTPHKVQKDSKKWIENAVNRFPF